MAQRAKISLSRPQVSPKVLGNGERSRIEALLVARFDTQKRSTSVAQYKTARNIVEEIVTFYSKLFIVCCTVL